MEYIKKAIPVEVVQFEYKEWLNDKSLYPMVLTDFPEYGNMRLPYVIASDGEVNVCNKDYIIKDNQGELYICKPNIFELAFEPYEEKTAEQMFDEAGFKLNLLETDKNYIQYDYIHEKEVTMSIIFCVEGKVYDIDTPKNHAIEMDLKTHKAINKQIEELGGWE